MFSVLFSNQMRQSLSCYHFSFGNCVTIILKKVRNEKNYTIEIMNAYERARASKRTTNVLLFDTFETRKHDMYLIMMMMMMQAMAMAMCILLLPLGIGKQNDTIESSFVTWNVAPDFAGIASASRHNFNGPFEKCWVAVSQMPSLTKYMFFKWIRTGASC